MKKMVFFLLVSLFAINCAEAKDVFTKDVEKLPTAAKEFVEKHFSKEQISYIKIDEELVYTTYEVVFVSGTEIEFTRDGEWKEIDTKLNAIPDSIVPANILQYVKNNFKDASIKQIEKRKRTYEVELSNHLDLKFDMQGNFIRIDD
ncbi:hypothetical protein D0T49_09920 [Paludibacter sp. 221]|uniref:PepSY-like domain-containing protein n=1 Tax=Paludibacter sp. 221 TaxID=2302939 RepID=UPI0013D57A47|nr:PepSY-like domain-containing protein [Paludibacter sp. 221]NDV47361.1 hypothetical protein [Paludibacter sp. 221]